MDNLVISFECPICLHTLIKPITLSCGHTFCQECIQHKYFYVSHSTCPLCRLPIMISPRHFKVSVLLESIIYQHHCDQEDYKSRLLQQQKNQRTRGRRTQVFWFYWRKFYKVMQKMVPLYIIGKSIRYNIHFTIVLGLIVYLSVKQSFVNQRLREIEKHLADEIIRLAHLIKAQALDETYSSDKGEIDLSNHIFSKLVKYLFTNCVRF